MVERIQRKAAPNPNAVHYYKNAEVLEIIKEYQAECNKCESEGKEVPPVPTPIWMALDQMSRKLGTRYNFANYTWKDEMIGLALEGAIKSVRNFDTSRFSNCFGYFNKIMWQRFVSVINDEKKQGDIKKNLLIQSGIAIDILNSADDDPHAGDYYNYVDSIVSVGD